MYNQLGDIARLHMRNRKQLNLSGSLEHASAISDKAVRVVMRLSRVPNDFAELASLASEKCGNKLSAVPDSFIVRNHTPGNVVVAGFMAKSPAVMSVYDAGENMTEIASNVYMDDRDRTVWTKHGATLVRREEDDLKEVASVIQENLNPAQRHRPEVALAHVQEEFAGVRNTEACTFFDPESNQVQFGVRVGDSHVFSEQAGLIEVAQDQIIHAQSLHGNDNLNYAELASVAEDGYDIDRTIQYYQKLFGSDAKFWSALEDQIREKSMH